MLRYFGWQFLAHRLRCRGDGTGCLPFLTWIGKDGLHKGNQIGLAAVQMLLHCRIGGDLAQVPNGRCCFIDECLCNSWHKHYLVRQGVFLDLHRFPSSRSARGQNPCAVATHDCRGWIECPEVGGQRFHGIENSLYHPLMSRRATGWVDGFIFGVVAEKR